MVLRYKRIAGRGRWTRGKVLQSEHQVWRDAGSTHWQMCHHVPPRHPEHLLSGLHLLVPTQHGHWHCLPLDPLAHVMRNDNKKKVIFFFDCETWFMIVDCFRSLMMGKSNHKFFDLSENKILQIYYTNRTVLFWMCTGNEAFYCALYLLYFTEGPICKSTFIYTNP